MRLFLVPVPWFELIAVLVIVLGLWTGIRGLWRSARSMIAYGKVTRTPFCPRCGDELGEYQPAWARGVVFWVCRPCNRAWSMRHLPGRCWRP